MSIYLSNPDINQNNLCFVGEDDLFTSNIDGSNNKRIVSGIGVISAPKFSPDGKSIAFRIMRGVHNNINEIFLCDLNGANLKQLTFFGSPLTGIAGWKSEVELVIYTDVDQPVRGITELYSINIGNSEIKKEPLGYGHKVCYSGESVLLGRNTVEIPFWKGYKGGTRGKLWYKKGKQSKFYKLLEIETNIHSPMIKDNTVYYISDPDGAANLYSYEIENKSTKKLTHVEENYIRSANIYGKSIVYSMSGDIWIYDLLSNSSSKVSVEIEPSGKKNIIRYLNMPLRIENFSSEDGNNVNIVTRGRGIIITHKEGASTYLNSKFDGRIRRIRQLSNGNLVAIKEISYEDAVVIFNQNGELVDQIELNIGIILNFKVSEDGKFTVFSNNRNELYIYTFEDKSLKIVDKSEFFKIREYDISPDGRLIAYSFPVGDNTSQIKLYEIEKAKIIEVTSRTSQDFSPSFDKTGLFLNYLSNRALDPTYDNLIFELGFMTIIKPFTVTLTKDTLNPFLTKFELPKEKISLIYDLENIHKRIEPFPVKSGLYEALNSGKGKIFYLKGEVEGSSKIYNMGDAGKGGSTLCCYDLTKKEERVILKDISRYEVSRDGEKILLEKNGDLYLVGQESTQENQQELAKNKVDLSKIKIKVDNENEFIQMFNETWRMMRESYWNPEMLKNWDQVKTKYSKFLPRVQTRADLSDILKQVQGEMGTSHSYEIGGDLTQIEYYPSGRIGAIFSEELKGSTVQKLFMGDPSNEGEKSPMIGPGINIEVGDTILEVDGEEVGISNPIMKHLLNKSGEFVRLKIKHKGGEITYAQVKLNKNDRHLIYRSWVEENRRYVHEKSNGKCGYIHIPDMGTNGFTEFHRLLSEETKRNNLIVDLRYNGGGHVSQLLLEKLARKKIGYDMPRYSKKTTYPAYSVEGKIIAITNEFAGSDGDIFSHAFKLMKLGDLVGTRTWGGVVGINPIASLIDGTVVTQPEYATYFDDVGTGVENYGTDPTIEVEITPEEFASGKDPQLDRAIEEVMRL